MASRAAIKQLQDALPEGCRLDTGSRQVDIHLPSVESASHDWVLIYERRRATWYPILLVGNTILPVDDETTGVADEDGLPAADAVIPLVTSLVEDRRRESRAP